MWASAEERLEGAPRDEFVAGVVLTCRWLAGRPAWSTVVKRFEMPRSPLLWRDVPAEPETVEAEYVAALAVQAGRDLVFASGVAAMLGWAWGGSGRAPVDVGDVAMD